MPSDSVDEAIAAEAATDDGAQCAWQVMSRQARVFKLDCRLQTVVADAADAATQACEGAKVPTAAETGNEGRDSRTAGVSHSCQHRIQLGPTANQARRNLLVVGRVVAVLCYQD